MIVPAPGVTVISSVVPVNDAATGAPALTPINNCPLVNIRSWTVLLTSIYGTLLGSRFGKSNCKWLIDLKLMYFG